MPISNKGQEDIFFWFLRNENVDYKIEINGIDETDNVLEASFKGAIIGEDSSFSLMIDNNNDLFTTKYQFGDVVDFYLEFIEGSGTPTKRLSYKIETITKEFGQYGNVLKLSGVYRYYISLLDLTITKSYAATTTGDNIIKELFSENIPAYDTTTYVMPTTIKPNISWEEIPFYDVILDVCNACGFDCYIDVNANVHFFERESINNDNEAVVHDDNLVEISGFKEDSVPIKNVVKVSSEDGSGIPIIYTSKNASSQSSYGIKERSIKDTNVSNYDDAKELADASQNPDTELNGETTSAMLPQLNPGDMIWVVEDSLNLHSRYRLISYEHDVFKNTTKCVFSQKSDLNTFFKERKTTESKMQNLKNPYKMEYSFNLNDTNWNDTIASKDSNVVISDGILRLGSGTTGNAFSIVHTAPITISYVHLKVAGEAIPGTVFRISTDGGNTYTIVPIDTLVSVTNGSSLDLEISFNSSSTQIKGIGILYK